MINNDIERLYDEKTTRHNLSTKLNLWCSYRIRKMAFKMTNSEKGRKQEDESQDWHPQAPGWSRRITYLTDEEVERKMLELEVLERGSRQTSKKSSSTSAGRETKEPEGEEVDMDIPTAAAEEATTAMVKWRSNSDATTAHNSNGTDAPMSIEVMGAAALPAGTSSVAAKASSVAASTLVISTVAVDPPQGRNSIVKRVREENRAKKARKELEETDNGPRGTVPRFRPPTLPGGYGSRQYPRYEDDDYITGPLPAFEYIADQNRWR